MPSPRLTLQRRRRRRLAAKHLRGSGLEIGALHEPLPLPDGVTVRYVDRFRVADLRRHYPELEDLPLVDVDVVDDGERLQMIDDASVDFVVANHVIEHTEDPLGTLATFLRVLRPGGTVFMAVPEASRGIDARRPLTTVEHVVADHELGPATSRRQHYVEYARLVDRVASPEGHGEALEAMGASIHFHVWSKDAFRALLEHARDALGMPLEVVTVASNGPEFLVVARRQSSAAASSSAKATSSMPSSALTDTRSSG